MNKTWDFNSCIRIICFYFFSKCTLCPQISNAKQNYNKTRSFVVALFPKYFKICLISRMQSSLLLFLYYIHSEVICLASPTFISFWLFSKKNNFVFGLMLFLRTLKIILKDKGIYLEKHRKYSHLRFLC